MPELKRSLGFWDGLAMVVGIMVGTGIFRTPGLVAQRLGRPALTFVAWAAGGAIAFLGALIFAELATRHPNAGGKYVYAREAFGKRAGFVVGWIEGLVYAVATAAIGVVAGEYAGRLVGVGDTRWLAAAIVLLFTAINLLGVASGRWVQNLSTAAKVAALAGVVIVALAKGDGSGWHSALSTAPAGSAVWGALAVAFQSVIWTYYGYLDAGKIAEEVVDPGRTLPRVFLGGIGVAAALYLLLNAAFFQTLPIERIAASNLVPGDVVSALFGAGGGTLVAGLALLVVLASLNGNVFVTPRVIFGLARVNTGGTPWAAMLLIGAVSTALAVTGTFERLLGLAIALVLVIDSWTVLALLRLRARTPLAPFRVPLYPLVPAVFLLVYAALFVGMAVADWRPAGVALGVVAVAYGLGRTGADGGGRRRTEEA